MSKLQIQYSKELARELGKIAIYLPGEHVSVGDIIKFPHGKVGFLRKKGPFGSFKKISSLKKLGVSYDEPQFLGTPDTYKFSSKNAVDFNFTTNGNADLGNDLTPSGNANLSIQFSSEGALYFLAIDCNKKELNDLAALENEINTKGKKLIWQDTYLVTSVTIAKKAFIAQSQSKNSELQIAGNFKGIASGTVEINAQTNLSIKKQKGNIFIKDWSNDVTVFMDLIKFEKQVFDENYRGFESTKLKEPKILLKPVNIEELL